MWELWSQNQGDKFRGATESNRREGEKENMSNKSYRNRQSVSEVSEDQFADAEDSTVVPTTAQTNQKQNHHHFYTHPDADFRANVNANAQAHAYANAQAQAHAHAYANAHARAHAHVHANTNINMNANRNMNADAHRALARAHAQLYGSPHTPNRMLMQGTERGVDFHALMGSLPEGLASTYRRRKMMESRMAAAAFTLGMENTNQQQERPDIMAAAQLREYVHTQPHTHTTTTTTPTPTTHTALVPAPAPVTFSEERFKVHTNIVEAAKRQINAKKRKLAAEIEYDALNETRQYHSAVMESVDAAAEPTINADATTMSTPATKRVRHDIDTQSKRHPTPDSEKIWTLDETQQQQQQPPPDATQPKPKITTTNKKEKSNTITAVENSHINSTECYPVFRAARAVAGELSSGVWPEASIGAGWQAAVAIEHFAKNVYLPNILARSARNRERMFQSTLLALREVMAQNASKIFKLPVEGNDEKERNEIDDEYSGRLLATSVVLSACSSCSPDDAESMLKLIDDYDNGHIKPPKAKRHWQPVIPSGKKLDAEDSITWRASFNALRKDHPSFSFTEFPPLPKPNAVFPCIVEKIPSSLKSIRKTK